MTKDALNVLSFSAMRYALGRKTYVVDMVCRALIDNAKDIRSDLRDKMKQEIKKAIDEGHAGMDCDIECWKKVLENL